MVAARQFGLETCPQAAFLSFYDVLQKRLGMPDTQMPDTQMPDTQMMVCGVSLGYPDPNAKANTFTPDRMSTREFVTFVDTLQDA
jgi:nitroreductase